MKLNIDMIGIVTSQLHEMRDFYKNVLGFEIEMETDHYVEFKSEGVRFSLGTRHILNKHTEHQSYLEDSHGQRFELAFKVNTPEDVYQTYDKVIEKGAIEIKAPEDMPWGQRTAFFADPDGNIHEIFCNL